MSIVVSTTLVSTEPGGLSTIQITLSWFSGAGLDVELVPFSRRASSAFRLLHIFAVCWRGI